MNMFTRFDENQAMNLQDIKETKRYGWRDGCTDAHTDGQRENSIPTTNKVCGGYNKQKHNYLFSFSSVIRVTPKHKNPWSIEVS